MIYKELVTGYLQREKLVELFAVFQLQYSG